MDEANQLFYLDTIYVSNEKTQEDVFRKVYFDLREKDLVTDDFLDNLIEREQNYPTGLDMSPIDTSYPNIAIPHTEAEFVKTTRIVPIKLNHPIPFHNMINPAEEFPVAYLFMILNGKGEEQAGILARIMDFCNGTDRKQMLKFFELEDKQKIYDFLKANFPQK